MGCDHGLGIPDPGGEPACRAIAAVPAAGSSKGAKEPEAVGMSRESRA